MSTHQIFQSINPATGAVVWEGPSASEQEVDMAVKAARKALNSWSSSLEERTCILRAFGDVVRSRSEEIATIIAKEIGKPLWESRTEVAAMAGKIEISITAHEKRCAEFQGGKALTRFKPHGVVVVMGPYNFPAHLPNGHICPALLAGNTVLFKPSELAPATAELVLSCWREAGLPEGVLQVLNGAAPTAKALAGHPDIDGLFFTGSCATGNLLSRQFASSPGKILALEMGGNNPLIVDTGHIEDLHAAAAITVHSAFLSAGQRCTCARRLIVVDSPAKDAFMGELLQQVKALDVGDPFGDPPPFMGPLASPAFVGKVLQSQKELVDSGAQCLLEARQLVADTGFVSPAILDVSSVDDLPDEEIFGPVLQILLRPDLDSAITTANATRFGLAAGVLTDSSERYKATYPLLQAGIINWNTQLTGASSAAPFGGIKASGNHRPSAYLAADYCSYPVASMEASKCLPPAPLPISPRGAG